MTRECYFPRRSSQSLSGRRGGAFFAFCIHSFLFRRFSKTDRKRAGRYRNYREVDVLDLCQWSERDFEMRSPGLRPKTPRAQRGGEKKKQCLWKLDGISENSLVVSVWKLPRLRDPITSSIHVIPFRREPPLRAQSPEISF